MPVALSKQRRGRADKAERLEARVTVEQKQLLQRAADLSGRTLTDFVLTVAQEAALRTIREMALVTLSAADQRAFVKSLLQPPAPNRRLRLAWRRFRKHGQR